MGTSLQPFTATSSGSQWFMAAENRSVTILLWVFTLTQNSLACTPVSVREQAFTSPRSPVTFLKAFWNTSWTVRAFSCICQPW